MSLLVQRGELNPLSPSHRVEIEAGGRWVAFGEPDPGELVAEIKARGVKSLVTFQRDLSFLRQVPQLEFLVVSSNPPDVGPIHDLPDLRRLGFSGTFGGRLDFGLLPTLESFDVNELPKVVLDTLFGGHPSLRSLGISPYRFTDLLPLGRLALRSLGLTGGLTSLAGAGAFATTLERLNLEMAPNLLTLDGIEALACVQVVEIEGLRHITTIEWAARLPRLRLLDVFEQKGIESLRPLAGHPSLEFLTFGRVKDLDLEPLGTIPNLKLFATGHYRWNRDLSDFPYMQDLPAEHPANLEYTSLKTRLTKPAISRKPRGETMGAWGSGPFDNDDAADWMYGLTPDADDRVLEQAFAAVEAEGYLEAPTSSAAIAAAEVVAGGLGHPHASLPDEVAEWVQTHGQVSWRALAPLAVRAIDRILGDSELKELWAESDEDGGWTAEVQDLRERLTS